MVKKHNTFLFTDLFVFNPLCAKLSLHFIFKDILVFRFDFSNGYFVKLFHRCTLSFFEDLIQFIFVHRGILHEALAEMAFKDFEALFNCLLALIFAYIAPRALDGGDCAFVDSFNIRRCKIVQHLTIKFLSVHSFGLDTVDYFSSQ